MILPLLLLAGKLLFGAAAAAGVAAVIFIICYDDVVRKLQQHKLHNKDIGVLVKQHMDNGNVRVVGSVFSKRPLGIFARKLQHEEVFEGKLDPQLESMFAQQDRVRVTI
jgi:hypothetical protein